MSKFVPIPNFDSLSPQTTKGDLIGRSTVGATRIPVGSDNTFLKADSTNALGVSWASPAGANLDVKTLTGATTLTTSNDIVMVSGTTFAVTLFSATSNSGKVLRIIKTDDITTSISVTGTGFIGVTLATKNEEYSIHCDGTTFWPFSHFCSTPWVVAGGVSISATTTAPVPGNSPSLNIVYWRREGDSAHIRQYLQNSTTTGASSASGDYKWPCPANMTIDTNKCTVYATVEGSGFWAGAYVVGIGSMGDGTTSDTCVVVPFDSTYVRLFGVNPTATGAASSGFNAMATAGSVFYCLDYIVPISGWGA